MNDLNKLNNKSTVFINHEVKDIPFILSYKDDGISKPLIILSHGFTENKEVFKNEIKEFVDLGYLVIAMDNHLHGERTGPKFSEIAYSDGELDIYQVRKAIKESADDLVTLINYYSDNEQVDQDKIAVMGVSMGGCLALRALVIEKRIKVALSIIGTPYWEDLPGDPDIAHATDKLNRLDEFVKEYNPVNNPEKFFPRHLLIQITENDPHVNANKVKQFYEILKPYYKSAPESLSLIVYPGLTHKYSSEMWKAALDWIKKYL